MTQPILVADVGQLPQGEGRVFSIAGQRVAVFHTRAGGVFATQADCPHKGGPLADGLVGGTSVMCPLHDRIYDLKTGAGPESECGISVYPVSLGADGKIWITIPPP